MNENNNYYDNVDKYSGLGHMVLSNNVTEPRYIFGKATRANHEKIFLSKKMCKQQFIGKTGPAPDYYITGNINFNRPTSCKIGTGKKLKNHNNNYDYYEQMYNQIDAIGSKNKTLKAGSKIRIGTAKRVFFIIQ